MHGKGVVLEVVFQEVDNTEYTKMFIEVLKDHFGRKLSADQLTLLAQAIEESRLGGQAPVNLAETLDENWEVIFPE